MTLIRMWKKYQNPGVPCDEVLKGSDKTKEQVAEELNHPKEYWQYCVLDTSSNQLWIEVAGVADVIGVPIGSLKLSDGWTHINCWIKGVWSPALFVSPEKAAELSNDTEYQAWLKELLEYFTDDRMDWTNFNGSLAA